jgi:hypothetical protein
VLAGADEAFVETFDVGIEPNRDHGAEVERRAGESTAAADARFSPKLAAVTVEGSDTGEGRRFRGD